MKESLPSGDPLVAAKYQEFLEKVESLRIKSSHERIQALRLLH